MNNLVNVSKLSKEFTGAYGYKTAVFRNISFTISDNDFESKLVSILAPKGAGKSVLLKILAGLMEPSEGEVKINSGKKPAIIYIPSEPSSFPWLSVYDNIAYVLKQNKLAADEIEIKRLISLTGLQGYESAFPDNKSLGFRFRISLARALALKPDVVLLDEPFANFDPETKEEIYSLLFKVIASEKTKLLLAASNITEAYMLSNKVFVMKGSSADSIIEIKPEGNIHGNDKIFLSKDYQQFLEKVEEYFSGEESKKILEL